MMNFILPFKQLMVDTCWEECLNSNISGDKTENSKGGNDYWIVKVDSWGMLNGRIQLGEYYD
jgi:TRAP-type mannitol/chloroaromatic compound transport system permease small subunit